MLAEKSGDDARNHASKAAIKAHKAISPVPGCDTDPPPRKMVPLSVQLRPGPPFLSLKFQASQ